MMQVCNCDAGWTGVACDQRMCKKGDDPLTATGTDNEVQVIGIGEYAATATNTDANTGGKFTLTYTDGNGEKWTTWGIDAVSPTAIQIEEALEALPNHAIPSVTVARVATGTGSHIFTVTFDNPANSGDQPLLEAGTGGCNVAGCQPLYTGVTGGGVAVLDKSFSYCADGTCELDGANQATATVQDGNKEF